FQQSAGHSLGSHREGDADARTRRKSGVALLSFGVSETRAIDPNPAFAEFQIRFRRNDKDDEAAGPDEAAL
ncbi:MAG: hypothetical protein KF729_39265, partial [Sandaracinaceae bacterium]|nr:hypothetical protein [Sandaracinaceae bacterium]